jgi:hypothetical protein
MRHDITEIVEQARQLLNTSGYPNVQIVSVTPDERKGVWNVKADVGVLQKEIKEVVINDRTSKVIEYH